MLKQYFLDIMRKGCNGLYLCEVPTGIGKSYQAAHAMEEYVKEIREEYAKAMRQCARTITDGRKLIYLTPLRKNVGEEEEELKKAYENEELFEKEVLHIKSNVDNIIENLGKVTIPQDKQPFNYDELKKQVKAYNGESSPEIKKIWEDKVEEEEKYIREFFDSLSDEEFVAMLLECGIERTKRASESDYVKTFCLDEKEIRGEKMSYWSFVHGTVTVLPFGRTQAEKRYLLDTVLDHLPKVTGSEGDMNIYCIQKNGYSESCSYTEFGEQKPFETLSTKMQSEYILVVDGNLRDRKFAQTYREFVKWLVRLSKRLGVEEVLVEIKDHAKYSLIQNRNQGNNGEPFSEIFEMVSWVEKEESNWCEYLLWEESEESNYPLMLEERYCRKKKGKELK